LFAGRSIGDLTRELNERGQAGERAALPVSGKLWSRQVLPVMLCRPALAGLLYHLGEEYGAIKGIEPIVSRAEWERMKALVAARKTGKPPAPRHPLSGEIMCGRCGRSRMYGTVRSGGRMYPDGEPRREYRCRPGRTGPRGCAGAGATTSMPA
jgi:hypothetical protein